jgi:hypothetical protein
MDAVLVLVHDIDGVDDSVALVDIVPVELSVVDSVVVAEIDDDIPAWVKTLGMLQKWT